MARGARRRSLWLMSRHESRGAKAGDLLEVRGLAGAPSRHGMILEVFGLPEHEHEHYLVRWDEEHESLFFPSDGEGVHVVHPRGRRTRA